jgi:hypothetical protein
MRADLPHALWIDHEGGIEGWSALLPCWRPISVQVLAHFTPICEPERRKSRPERPASGRRPGSASFLKAMVKRK